MAKNDAISNEQIIAALLSHGTQRATAAAVGMSERALYDRMNKGSFQAQYKAAKADLLRQTVLNLNGQTLAAIETIVTVMKDPDSSPTARLQAAQMILSNAEKMGRRLQEHEEAAKGQVDSNRFDPFA